MSFEIEIYDLCSINNRDMSDMSANIGCNNVILLLHILYNLNFLLSYIK